MTLTRVGKAEKRNQVEHVLDRKCLTAFKKSHSIVFKGSKDIL